MNIFLSLTVIFMLLLWGAPVNALSDADYTAFIKSSPEFRNEDQKLGNVYKKIMKETEGEYKTQIRDDQRKWLKTDLDQEAAGYMKKGMSKIKAYTRAYHNRYNILRVIDENNNLSEADIAAGRVKPDDYYNANEDLDEIGEVEMPDNCGSVQGATQLIGNVRELTLKNNKGNIDFYYYIYPDGDTEIDCGMIDRFICFDVLGKKLIKFQNDERTSQLLSIIGNCRAPN